MIIRSLIILCWSGLPDHLKCFQGRFVFQELQWTTFIGVHRGVKRVFAPPTLEIGTKNQKMLENLKSTSRFRLIDLLLATTQYLPVWHSQGRHQADVAALGPAPLGPHAIVFR